MRRVLMHNLGLLLRQRQELVTSLTVRTVQTLSWAISRAYEPLKHPSNLGAATVSTASLSRGKPCTRRRVVVIALFHPPTHIFAFTLTLAQAQSLTISLTCHRRACPYPARTCSRT